MAPIGCPHFALVRRPLSIRMWLSPGRRRRMRTNERRGKHWYYAQLLGFRGWPPAFYAFEIRRDGIPFF
jgi:hypothetical protein